MGLPIGYYKGKFPQSNSNQTLKKNKEDSFPCKLSGIFLKIPEILRKTADFYHFAPRN